MSWKLKLLRKLLPIEFPDSAWQLFGKYVVVMNYDILRAGKDEQLSYTKAIGLIVTTYLLQDSERIQRRFDEIHLEARQHEIAGLFTASQLAAIGTAAGADIPKLLRARPNKPAGNRYVGRSANEEGVVFRTARGPHSTVPRHGAKARSIRGRSLQIEPGLSPRKKKAQ